MRVTLVGLSSQYIHMTLAPWCLKAAIEAARPQDQVTICEMNINEPPEKLMRRVMDTSPELVGFSVYIWNRTMTATLTRRIRAGFPQVLLALGGPEVTYCPEEAMADMPCDYLLRGAGEKALPALLDALEHASALEEVEGLCFRTGQRLHVGDVALPQAPTTAPYSPAFFEALRGRMAYVETSRGCPFSCAFCLSGKKDTVRFMPREEALSLLIRLGASGVSIVKLIDRTFNCDRARTRFLLQGLIDAKTRGMIGEVCYHLEVAADLFDDETLTLLRLAPEGLFQMEAGLQSFHEETLARCQRHTDMQRLTGTLRALMDMGNIHLHIDLIAGLPQEDLPTFAASFNKAYALEPHMFQLGFLKLIHGSRLREQAREDDCRFSPDPPYEVLSTRCLSYRDLCTLKDVEQALDRLYNSGKFQKTLRFALAHLNMTPYGFFLRMGRRIAEEQGSISHERLTELVIRELCDLGLEGEAIRDQLVEDRLATDNTGYLPPLLAGDMTALKQAARLYRAAHPEAKHARFALVEQGRTLLVAQWNALHPVTRLGAVVHLPNPGQQRA